MEVINNTMQPTTATPQYLPELWRDYWYVAAYDLSTNDLSTIGHPRIPMTGTGPCWVNSERSEALKYANSINKANGYPEAQ